MKANSNRITMKAIVIFNNKNFLEKKNINLFELSLNIYTFYKFLI